MRCGMVIWLRVVIAFRIYQCYQRFLKSEIGLALFDDMNSANLLASSSRQPLRRSVTVNGASRSDVEQSLWRGLAWFLE
jgi:hypothetical protein